MTATRIRHVVSLLVCSSLGLAQNAPKPATSQPVAILGGEAISEEELLSQMPAQLRQLRQQEYEQKIRALEALVNQKLVEAEAKKKGTSSEKLLEQEVDSKVPDPTDGEAEAYYLAQRDRIKRPLNEVKAQVKQALKQAKLQEARQAYLQRLRNQSEVTILLQPPKVEVAYDPARLRGSATAPITIVEFSDFQCPFCQRVQATLTEVLGKYKDRVKLAYRDFPLQQIHPQAQMAAEASRCAADQGKFWQYHDALFANFGKLDQASLLEQARSVKLDEATFQSCLAGGKHKAAVEKDLTDGNALGVNGTPAFFVNGVSLSGAQPASAFEKIIDEELASTGEKRRAR